MKKAIFTSLFLVALLTSCSLPRMTPTPSADDMPTRISALLTAMVTMTPQIETAVISTPTIPPATATPQPTATQTLAPTEEAMTATPTSEKTETVEATSTPIGTPTSPADDPAKIYGNPTWADTFENGNNWPIGVDSFTSAKVTGGKMVVTGLTTKDGWRVSNVQGINYYVQLTGKMLTCSGTDHFGIIFRVPTAVRADQGYIFTVTCDGRYSLRKWNVDKMTSLIDYKESDAILKGSNQTNRIGVQAAGSKLTLYINGVKVNEYIDNAYLYGYYGIIVGSRQTTNLTVEFDEMDYWKLK